MTEAIIYGAASLFFLYLMLSMIKVIKYVRSPEVSEAEEPPYPKIFIPYLKYSLPLFIVVFAFMFLVNLGQCLLIIVKG